MQSSAVGNLLIIGGSEDKHGECLILRKFVALAGGSKARIVVLTTATEFPREVGDEYRELFLKIGVDSAMMLTIPDRQSAHNQQQVVPIEEASGIFFTGGDQLRLTSILGGTAVDHAIRQAAAHGTVIAGTSAGASVMSDTMIVEGGARDTPKKETISMAHGMGLLHGVVIDQHFAQRGRINRLLSAVAQNPRVLGIGIDEDTALVVSNTKCEVIGSQAVTVLDGQNILHSTISESRRYEPLAITQIALHILPAGFGFDLERRTPYICR
jgi:cyanophycinase